MDLTLEYFKYIPEPLDLDIGKRFITDKDFVVLLIKRTSSGFRGIEESSEELLSIDHEGNIIGDCNFGKKLEEVCYD